MAGLFCAIILIGATHQIETSSSAVRSLYERAARLIADGQVDASIEPLEAIVRQHAQSPVAEVAAVHLAEGYLIGERLAEADQLLRDWRTRIDQSPTAETLSPGLSQRARGLSCRTARELAAAACGRQDMPTALQWLDQASEFASTSELSLIRAEKLRIQTLTIHKLLIQQLDAESIFASCTETEQVAIRFALAEQLLASNHPELSEQQWQWLTEHSRRNQDTRPRWATTVDLRLAELWMAKKNYPAALKLLQESRARNDQAAYVHEFDFLSARCAIAQIDFDLARNHLQAIAGAEQTAEPVARARAYWMLGEVALLQRDYAQAIAVYEQAIALDASEWQSRALLQKARCQELTAASSEAAASYQRLVDCFGNTHCGRIAELRLATLTTGQPLSTSIPKVEK